MTYSDAIAGVDAGTSYGYRDNWPSPKAIVKVNGVVEMWLQTSQGQYTPSGNDTSATNWILKPYNGDLPPR